MTVVEGPRVPDNNLVICPACTHQFRGIPVEVQRQMSLQKEDLIRCMTNFEAVQENLKAIIANRKHPLLPLGCRIGVWHAWGHWAGHWAGESYLTPLSRVSTGKLLIQQRACRGCGSVQLRTEHSS